MGSFPGIKKLALPGPCKPHIACKPPTGGGIKIPAEKVAERWGKKVGWGWEDGGWTSEENSFFPFYSALPKYVELLWGYKGRIKKGYRNKPVTPCYYW